MIKTIPWLGVFASVCVAPSASAQEAEGSASNETAPMPEPEIVWVQKEVSQPVDEDAEALRRVRPRNNPGSWITMNDYKPSWIRRHMEGTVGFELTVATNGRVSNCRVGKSSEYQQLDDSTCRLVTRRARFTPAADENGRLVEGRYVGTVRWQLPKATLPRAFFVKYKIEISDKGIVTSCQLQRASGQVPRQYSESVLCPRYSSELYEIIPDENGVKNGKTLIVRHGIEVPAVASVE